MPAWMVFAYAGAMVVAGVVRYLTLERAKILREIRRHPVVSIKDAADGEVVRLIGTATADGDTLLAPLTDRPCLAWQVLVWKRVEGNNHPVKCLDAADSVPFLLVEDGAEQWRATAARIAKQSLDLALQQDAALRAGAGNPDTLLRWEAMPHSIDEARLISFLDGRGVDGSEAFQACEAVLEPDERVTVVGKARWRAASSGGGGYRGGEHALYIENMDDGRLLISDEPKAT